MLSNSRLLLSRMIAIAQVTACMAWPTIANTGQASKSFNVTVNLHSPGSPQANQPNSAFCHISNNPNTFGATYTVVCATGAVVDMEPERTGQSFSPIHGGAYRYLFQANRGSNQIGTIDSDIAAGTTASWRLVNLSDRDYLEMLVNW